MPYFLGSSFKFSTYSLKQILCQSGEKQNLIFVTFLADPDQLKEKVKDLETQLKTSDLEKQHLKVILSNYNITNVLWKLLKTFMNTTFES